VSRLCGNPKRGASVPELVCWKGMFLVQVQGGLMLHR
jgi:hypothetical protein